ncbi:hypothetical protein B808_149 [Fructilactobacillus florum 8D]|uniref:GTP cyclohydrolase 1 type 2 homolog n=1 Tax=Fructilactobacillus florum 8D TaxID=1221538 RepID=W9EMH3_9LACO|nr:Nif3-like dinuclear metal center hexameric protein [Fructilactobacillus florum]ETO40869.1 hypothetical protein B808_149 [Fructilactobacillus florum 8D]
MTTVQTIVDQFEKFAPLVYKEEGDPTGFQLGNREAVVHKLLTTLDVRPAVVQEAIDSDCDFIVAHHPLIFFPASNLDEADPQTKMYANLLRHHINVYSAHTNLDKAPGGMNDWLAAALQLQQVSGLVPDAAPVQGEMLSLGRVGYLNQPVTVAELVELCKQRLGVDHLRYATATLQKKVQKIAVLGGTGGKFYPAALEAGADAYLTGDLSYHITQEMVAKGLTVLDPGHHIESICKEQLKTMFSNWNKKFKWEIEVQASEIRTDPFYFN